MIPRYGWVIGGWSSIAIAITFYLFFSFGERAFTTLRDMGRLILLMFLFHWARGVLRQSSRP